MPLNRSYLHTVGKTATNPQKHPENPKYLLPSAEHAQWGWHREGTCSAARTSCLALAPPYFELNCGYKRQKAPYESRGGLHFPMLLIIFISWFSTSISQRRDEKKKVWANQFSDLTLQISDAEEQLFLGSHWSCPPLSPLLWIYQQRSFPMKTLILI